MAKIPVILLAAGNSSRLGQPKQLLPWGDKTLIEHQLQTLLETGNPVSVVLGSNSNLILPVIEKFPLNIFINDDWESGMGSSISFGISQTIIRIPDAQGVLITLVDQPMVTTSYLQQMLGNFQSGSKQILASRSASGWAGVPALFDRCYFDELSEIHHYQGARKVINRHLDKTILLEASEMLEDIDTMPSYLFLLSKFNDQTRF